MANLYSNDTVIRRHIRQFSFDLKLDMRLIVDGVQRGSTKQLAFRIAQPLQFDEEQEELLKSIVSSFKYFESDTPQEALQLLRSASQGGGTSAPKR